MSAKKFAKRATGMRLAKQELEDVLPWSLINISSRLSLIRFVIPRPVPTTHRAKIIGWPYSIYFTVLKQKRLVKIVAVWQGNQDPAVLLRRLR